MSRRFTRVVPKSPAFGLAHNLRDAFNWEGIIALLVGVAITVVGAASAATDPHGENPWGSGLVLGAVVVAGYTTLNLCWRATDALNMQWWYRAWVVSAVAAAVNTIATLITVLVVPIQYAKHDFQYWLGGPFWLIPLLGGFTGGMAAATLVFVAITLPFVSIARSRIAIRANMLSENPAFIASNRRAMIGFSVMLILIFLVSTLVGVGASSGNWPVVWAGAVLAVPMFFLMFFVSYSQRPAKLSEYLGVEKWQLEPDAQPRRDR